MRGPSLAVPLHLEADGPDSLLMCLTRTPHNYALAQWAGNEPSLHQFPPDYHRLQVERFLWDHRDDLVGKDVLDIGVLIRREWVGPYYHTLGPMDCDITADVQDMPISSGTVDAVICTEVLEHVPDPAQAMREIYRVLKPGGVFLGAAPFYWPWHGCQDYDDYWRITHQGWRLLTRAFLSTAITETKWTDEALPLLDLIRRFEGWGWESGVTAATGYLVRAVK